MSVTEQSPRNQQDRVMAYGIRQMEERDIPQVAEIEREAFPGMWPPTPLRQELGNRVARYLVAWRPASIEPQAAPPGPASASRSGAPLFHRLAKGVRAALGGSPEGQAWEPQGPTDFIAGFVGTWFMVDEAHITGIAARSPYRGQGIGELLLIAAIELAALRGCRVVTLEVRVSNTVAQSLYLKYGFNNDGVRRGYYTDNNEDAFIMTTVPITTPEYQARFRHLVEAHHQRWGESRRVIS
ncbi:MAG: ribosomal protein S18-alanine N-acetyltransferase [Chloroflexi bacterium]|nr:ribosomal protein S18-alanine N-acetyltransferase [Chloroflexota bacterium]